MTPREVFDAWAGFRTHLISVGVGILSVVLALTLPIEKIAYAGMIYALQGPLHWRNGVLIERARAKRFSARADAR